VGKIQAKELKARIAYLEDILENIPVGIIIIDPAGKILMMNQWQEKISHIKRDQVLGTLFHETWERLFDQGLSDSYWSLLHKDKSYHVVLNEIYPQFYDQLIVGLSRGAPLSEGRGYVLLHDLVEELKKERSVLRQLTQQLAETSQFLTNLIDSSPNIVVATDEIGYIHLLNRTGEEAFGCGKRKLVGRHISELFFDPSECDRITSLAEKGDAVEVVCKKKNGQTFPAKMYRRHIDETESARRILYLLSDISWQKNMEARLALSEKLANYSELAAGIAHQLNNPLVGVINVSALLLAKMEDSDPTRALAEMIHEAGKKCHNMLSYVTKSLREPTSVFSIVNLPEILDNSILAAKNDESEIAKKISINKKIPHCLPKVRGDSIQMLEALRNIVVNAFQAMPDGGRLFLGIRMDKKRVINVIVRDYGIGIPKENIPMIFNPFFTTKTNSGGGLGLSFALHVIKSHGGWIEVKSSIGKGTTVKVSLPNIVENGKHR
jgi:PAS domain S-box-containing protein